MRELDGARRAPEGKQRASGAGRPRLEEAQPGLLDALEELISPGTRADPESPLRWTTKSLRNLSESLRERGFTAGRTVLGEILHCLGYSQQATRKKTEGKQHPDRDAQFERIHDTMAEFIAAGQPAVSVDAKKKELVGDSKQEGREWQLKEKPIPVRVHDFVDLQLGKVAPYGVFDMAKNLGWVSVGISADTGEFATASVRRWWERVGSNGYPDAKRLLIIADGGGSNRSRLRACKVDMQALADDIGIPITVMPLPPGTSKWNKIEHRVFCHIIQQFRGRPLVSRELVVQLVAHTTTRAGLPVEAELDTNIYLKGQRISDEVVDCVNIVRDEFHGEWNYTIHPNI
jgi:hypothetical protein